jgi:hypothetical protein
MTARPYDPMTTTINDDVIDRVIAFLKSRAAAEIAHLNGTLLSHLEGTYTFLRTWGSSQELCLAGLCHAAYGTDGFPVSLIDVSRRSELDQVIGTRAEELVYFYASCDRSYVYPRIRGTPSLEFRDRFTAAVFVPRAELLRSFLELTFANELEIARNNRDFVARNRAALVDLFRRSKGLVSDAATRDFLDTFAAAS